jgi:hypothetical protein
MHFSPTSCHFISLRSKYSSQHPVLKHYNFVYSKFYVCRQQTRIQKFWTEWWKALPEFSLLFISSWIKFWFVTVVPKYLNCATFSKHLLATFMSWFCPAFW